MSPDVRRNEHLTIVMRPGSHAPTALQNVPEVVLGDPDRLLHYLKHVQELGWENDTRPMMADLIPVLQQAGASDSLWLQLIFSEMSLRGFYGDPFNGEDYVEAFPHLREQLQAWFPAKPTVDLSGEVLKRTPISRHSSSSILTGLSRNPDYPEIPGYEVQDVIGRGGMGIVFRARQLGLDRIVALKVIISGYNSQDTDRTRFRMEAEAVGRVRHPNIVQVFGYGEHRGVPWLALEYVPGGTLSQLTRDRPQDIRFSASLVETLAHAVAAAHRCSVIHRDLKPANILLEVYPPDDAGVPVGARLADGRQIVPRVTDFGLALRTDREQLNLTSQGVIAGTPGYMAPEQIAVDDRLAVGPHSDIWALGVMLYELLTGELPFTGVSSYDIVEKVVRGDPASLRSLRSDVPRDLEIVCLKCLEKAPALRYATASDLAADLRRFLDGESIRARPVGPIGSAVRWVRRNPAVSAMGACLIASMGFWTAESLNQTSLARAETRLIAAQASEIESQKLHAERMTRDAEALVAETRRQKAEIQKQAEWRTRELYAARMMNAYQAWRMGQVARTREALENYEPLRADAPDYRGFEWYHLRSRTQSESSTFATHSPAVGVAFSPDGDRIALADRGGIRIVRTDDRSEILRLDDCDGAPTAIAWSPTGERLLVGDSTGTLFLRDSRTGRLLGTPRQLGGPVDKVDFWSDGRAWAAIANPAPSDTRSTGGEIAVCDSRGEFRVVNPSVGRLTDLSCGAGNALAVVSADRFLWLKSNGTSPPLRLRFSDNCTSVALSPDTDRIALGWRTGHVSLFDPTTRREVWRAPAQTGQVNAIRWSPDGRSLLTGGIEPIVRLRSGATGDPIRSFRGHSSSISGVRLSPAMGSAAIASVSDDHSIRLWGIDADASDVAVRIPERPVRLFPSSGDTFCLMDDGSISRIDPQGRKTVPVSTTASGSNVFDGCLLSDGTAVLAIDSESEILRTEVATGTVSVVHLPGMRSRPTRIVSSATRLALGFQDGSVGVWLLDSTALPTIFAAHDLAVDSLDFSPDGTQLISGGRDGRVRVVDLATGRVRLSQKLHPGRVGVVRFSPTGEEFASGGDDNRIHVRRVADGRSACPSMAHAGPIQDLVFTADGRRVISCGDDLSVRIWDRVTGQEVMTIRLPTNGASLALSPSTKRLTLAGGRAMVRSWGADVSPRAEALIQCLAHTDVRLDGVPTTLVVGERVGANIVLETASPRLDPLSADALEDWKRMVRLVATLEVDRTDAGTEGVADDPLAARVAVGQWIPVRPPDSTEPASTLPIDFLVPEVAPGRYRLRLELVRQDELSRVVASHRVPVVVPVRRGEK